MIFMKEFVEINNNIDDKTRQNLSRRFKNSQHNSLDEQNFVREACLYHFSTNEPSN